MSTSLSAQTGKESRWRAVDFKNRRVRGREKCRMMIKRKCCASNSAKEREIKRFITNPGIRGENKCSKSQVYKNNRKKIDSNHNNDNPSNLSNDDTISILISITFPDAAS